MYSYSNIRTDTRSAEVDHIREQLARFSDRTADDQRWINEHARSWLHVLLRRIDDLERDLATASAKPAVEVGELDPPDSCYCAVIARPPCSFCTHPDQLA